MVAYVIYDGDDDDVAWCSDCDARLYERKDESHVCSNPSCGRVYQPNSVKKHKTGLHPVVDPYEIEGPALLPLTSYYTKKKKKPSLGDKEDQAFVSKKSELSITSYEEYLPEGSEKSDK
jgi:hypothetical protein